MTILVFLSIIKHEWGFINKIFVIVRLKIQSKMILLISTESSKIKTIMENRT